LLLYRAVIALEINRVWNLAGSCNSQVSEVTFVLQPLDLPSIPSGLISSYFQGLHSPFP